MRGGRFAAFEIGESSRTELQRLIQRPGLALMRARLRGGRCAAFEIRSGERTIEIDVDGFSDHDVR